MRAKIRSVVGGVFVLATLTLGGALAFGGGDDGNAVGPQRPSESEKQALIAGKASARAAAGLENPLGLSGSGIDPQSKLVIDLRNQPSTQTRDWQLPAALGISAPAPKLIVSTGPEAVETLQAAGQLQSVEAKFATAPPAPVGFSMPWSMQFLNK